MYYFFTKYYNIGTDIIVYVKPMGISINGNECK